MTQKDHKD